MILDRLLRREHYRLLRAEEMPLLAEHLCRLDEIDRIHRFHAPLDDDAIRALVLSREVEQEAIGWFRRGVLRGAAELFYAYDGRAEAGITVEAAYRGRGAGHELVRRALLRARARGCGTLTVLCHRGNRAMIQIAARFGGEMSLERRQPIEPLVSEPALPAWFVFDLDALPENVARPPGFWRRLLGRARGDA